MTLAVLLAVFRIGIIGCDTSHTEVFAKIANVDKDPRVAGFLVTCAYKWGSADIVSSTNRYPSIIAKLREMGVEMKDSIADLLKDCDGVLLETCDGRPHYAQALEVFKSGKPCFIDKPVAADIKDVVRIVEAGGKYNAKWFCTSALRFLPGIAEVRSGKAGKIRGVETWTPIETDPTQSRYYWYAIHGAEPLFAAMGTGCESVSVVSTGSDEILTGVWSDGRIGVVHATPWGKGAGHGGMYFPEDDYHPQPVSFGKYLGYPPLLASIVEFFRTGKAPVTSKETLEIYAFLSAAEKSRKQGGAAVRIDSVLAEAAGCRTSLYPGDERVLPSASLRPWRLPFKIGIARYTMYAVSMEKALATMQEIDCHYMGLLSGVLSYDADDAEIAAYRARLAKYGVEVVTAGPEYYHTAEQAEKLFKFAKRCGFKTVSVVPYETRPDAKDPTKTVRVESERMLDVLERQVKKYDIRAAIHNHGPDIPLLFPTAEAVWARIKDRDPRIGFCLDIGHHLRAGGDPEAAIRKYGSRIYEIHLKNVSEANPAGHAMQAPRGMIDELRVFQALVDVGFTGYCLIEYERDYCENAMGLAESMGYYRGVAEGVRPRK